MKPNMEPTTEKKDFSARVLFAVLLLLTILMILIGKFIVTVP